MPIGVHLDENEKNLILRFWKEGYSQQEIADKLYITKAGVYRVLRKSNIKIRKEKLSPEQIENFLIDYNNYMSRKDLENKYNICCSTINSYISKYNKKIRIKKTIADQNYFQNIQDSQEKLWLLGWIYSDGYNAGSYFNITVHSQDYTVLLKFQNLLNGRIYKSTVGECFEFRVFGKQISQTLSYLGAIKKKSLIVKWPRLFCDQDYWWFLRGLFEGDGTIAYRKGNPRHCHASIASGSLEFMKEIQIFLDKFNFITKIDFHKIDKNIGNSKFTVSGKISIMGGAKEVLRFLDFLYINSLEGLRLKRKYDKYCHAKISYQNPLPRLDSNAHRYKTVFLKNIQTQQYYKITGLRRFAQDLNLDDIKFEKQCERWKRNNYKKEIIYENWKFIQEFEIPIVAQVIEKDYRNIPIPYKFTKSHPKWFKNDNL